MPVALILGALGILTIGAVGAYGVNQTSQGLTDSEKLLAGCAGAALIILAVNHAKNK